MAPSYAVCPKCGQRPSTPLGATDACPACGVYMHKWQQIQQDAAAAEADVQAALQAPQVPRSSFEALTQFDDWRSRLLTLNESEPSQLAVRAVVLVLLALWQLRLATLSLADGEINGNFMHGIVLTIHEAGHVFFVPFGEFLTIAGGSIFQVALPFGIAVAFLLKNRDPFGAAVCLWWSAMSLIDVAPYIYDALQPQLILLGGHTGEDGPHDWIYIFERLGGLRHSQRWGRLVHIVGILLGIAALAWAAAVLWLARQRDTQGD